MNVNRQRSSIKPKPVTSFGNADSDEKIKRKLEFIFCLYDMQYKEEKSFNRRLNEMISRTFSKTDAANKAVTLSRRISASFSLFGAKSVTWGEVRRLQQALESFSQDIGAIIRGPPNNPYCLATRAFQFGKQWNKLILSMDGHFLEGFGDIYISELSISNPPTMALFLMKLRKAREVPTELTSLHQKMNQRAVTKSIDAHVAFQTKMLSEP